MKLRAGIYFGVRAKHELRTCMGTSSLGMEAPSETAEVNVFRQWWFWTAGASGAAAAVATVAAVTGGSIVTYYLVIPPVPPAGTAGTVDWRSPAAAR